MLLILVTLCLWIPGSAADICTEITCENGGTCVVRTATYWWCECVKGWTGRNCQHNACNTKRFIRIPGHHLDNQGADTTLGTSDPYSCMEQAETFGILWKSLYLQITAGNCNLFFGKIQHTESLVADDYIDYYENCGCNDFFDDIPAFTDTTLSPVCYMTETSSIVQLTCPHGHVFAENNSRTIEVQCTCYQSTGYMPENVNCLSLCVVQNYTCLNGGNCTVNGVLEPVCDCPSLTTGEHCETVTETATSDILTTTEPISTDIVNNGTEGTTSQAPTTANDETAVSDILTSTTLTSVTEMATSDISTTTTESISTAIVNNGTEGTTSGISNTETSAFPTQVPTTADDEITVSATILTSPPDTSYSSTQTKSPAASEICWTLPEIMNSTIIFPHNASAPMMVNETLTFRCVDHYYFPTKRRNMKIRCEGNDSWTPHEGNCYRYFCPEPPAVQNTVRVGNIYTENSQVSYTCVEDYSFLTDPDKSQHIINCTYLIWRGLPVPQCIRRQCKPLRIKNADIHTTTETQAGTWVTFKCHRGFQQDDHTTLRSIGCLSSGRWHTTPLPHCEPIPPEQKDEDACEHPPYLPHGHLLSAGRTIQLACEPGYKFFDGWTMHELDCDTAIDEVGRPPHVCVDISCSPPPTLDHALRSSSAAISGTVVKYDCERGYWFPDETFSKSIICSNTSEWMGDQLENCTRTYCPDISELYGASVTETNRSVGAEVVLSCDEPDDRFLDGKKVKELICLGSGKWNQLISNCSDDRCSAIPEVAHSKASTIIAQFGTNVTFQCETGYEFPDNTHSVTTQCDRQAQAWNCNVSDCEVVCCPAIPEIESSKGNLLSDETTFSSTVIYTCIDGYLSGDGQKSFNATCSSAGSWLFERESTVCLAVPCVVVGHVENGTVNTTEHSLGTVLLLQCHAGYELKKGEESRTIECMRGGIWSAEITSCRLKRCQPIATWSGLSPDRVGDFYVGSKVNYTCAVNYTSAERPVDYWISHCSANGEWEPSLVQCQAVPDHSFAVIPPTEASHAQSFGIVAGIINGLVVLLIVVIDLINFSLPAKRHLPKGKLKVRLKRNIRRKAWDKVKLH